MSGTANVDKLLSDWMHDIGEPEPSAEVYRAAFAEAARTRQSRPVPAWIAARLPLSTTFEEPTGVLRRRWTVIVMAGLLLLALLGATLAGVGSRQDAERAAEPVGVFMPLAPLPLPLDGPSVVTAAVALADGGALIAAGAELIRFDATTGSFRRAGALPEGSAPDTLVTLHDGRVLMLGNLSMAERPGPDDRYAFLYDPASGSLTRTGSMVDRRMASAATVLRDGRVLISGGEAGFAVASAEIYDPATGTFSATGSMSRPRSMHSSVLLPDGRVLVLGGAGAPVDASAELYDPATGTFQPAGPMAFPQAYSTATPLLDGRVLLVGGSTAGASPDEDAATGRAQVFDPDTGRFSEAGSLPGPRSHHAAALLPDGRVLIAGGALEPRSRTNVTADAQVFDPSTGLFTTARSMLQARFNFHTVPLADGRVLIVGHHWLNPLPDGLLADEDRLQRSAEIYQ